MLLGICLITLFLIVGVLALGAFCMPLGMYVKTYCRGRTDERRIAISFDDGPEPGITERVLDVLDKWEVKATFFLIGKKVEKNPQLVHRIVARGHLVGIHTYSHIPKFTYALTHVVVRELAQCQGLIQSTVGITTRLFRPPYGVTNPRIGRAVRRLSLRTIGWSIRSLDTVRTHERAYRRIMQRLHPGGVVLLHDNLPEADVLLDRVLRGIAERGYEIRPLTEILDITPYENI